MRNTGDTPDRGTGEDAEERREKEGGGKRRPTRRIRNPAWLALIIAASALAGVGGFLAASVIAESPEAALIEADAPITVTAPVEIRVVDSRATYSGTIAAGSTAGLIPAIPSDLPVVTRQPLSIGDKVTGGSLLGAVADAPTFALVGILPTYRDLRPGDVGDDVKALQEAMVRAGLDVAITSLVDWSTLAAAERLFVDAGYALPRETVTPAKDADPSEKQEQMLIPITAFVGVPAEDLVVVAVAKEGSQLGEEASLVTVRTSADAVVFRASPDQVADVEPGTPVNVRTAAASVEGIVESIGDFQAGGDGLVPGRDVRVKVDPAALADAGVGTSVVVSGLGAEVESLAVPTVALREDARGSYLFVLGDDDKRIRVEVSVTAFGGGWSAVTSEALQAGDPVIIS